MNASVTVVTTKWVFRYIHEPMSSTQPARIAHCWMSGSTNTCSACCRSTMSRALANAAADWSYTCPRTSR